MDKQDTPTPLSKYADEQQKDPVAAPAGPAAPATPSGDATTFGMLCHLLALTGYIIPFGNIIGPLVVWMMKKNDSEFIDACGRDSINFQISILIYMIVAGILVLVVIGIPLLIALGIFNLVCVIIASIKAADGVRYSYPLTLRFLR